MLTGNVFVIYPDMLLSDIKSRRGRRGVIHVIPPLAFLLQTPQILKTFVSFCSSNSNPRPNAPRLLPLEFLFTPFEISKRAWVLSRSSYFNIYFWLKKKKITILFRLRQQTSECCSADQEQLCCCENNNGKTKTFGYERSMKIVFLETQHDLYLIHTQIVYVDSINFKNIVLRDQNSCCVLKKTIFMFRS